MAVGLCEGLPRWGLVGVGQVVADGGDVWPPWTAHALHGVETGLVVVAGLVVLLNSVECRVSELAG